MTVTAPGSGNAFESLFECGRGGGGIRTGCLSLWHLLWFPTAAWVLDSSGIRCCVVAGAAQPATGLRGDTPLGPLGSMQDESLRGGASPGRRAEQLGPHHLLSGLRCHVQVEEGK